MYVEYKYFGVKIYIYIYIEINIQSQSYIEHGGFF